MKIVVTGGTGFVGRSVVRALLARGDEVTVFGRSASSIERKFADAGGPVRAVAWQPMEQGEWQREVDGQDAIVHLAGEQAVGKRWNEKVKQRILKSRTLSTGNLVKAIKKAADKPSVFVCASAVGYYGDTDEACDETTEPGDDFLALVCLGWEAATKAAEDSGVRVVNARLGIVLGPDGGPLEEMAKPFRAFVGGPIGSGKQYVSWVHIDDVVGMILRGIDDDTVRGPVNVAAPNAVTNAELSKAIGAALGRPSFMPVPEFALRLRFGEGADPLVTGQRAIPAKMQELGFAFSYTDVRAAVAQALGDS